MAAPERSTTWFSGPERDEALVEAAPTMGVREIFRRFWPYARPYRRLIALGLLFVAIEPALDAAMIWLFKILVDRVLIPADFGLFLLLAGAYISLTLVEGALSFADDYVAAWTGEKFLLNLRTSVFRHVQGLPLEFFERRRLGDVMTRVTGDVAEIEQFVLSGIASALSYVVRLAVFVGLLFYLSWRLALVALVVVPLFWLAARQFSGRIRAAAREKRRRSGSLSVIAEESFANNLVVQAFNQQDTEVARFERQGEGRLRAEMTATKLRATFAPLIDMIELTGGLLVLGIGVWELSRGNLTVGGLLVFVAYLTKLYSPVRGFGRLANSVAAAAASAERIAELLDERPAVTDSPTARRLRAPAGRVSFERVSYRYPGANKNALTNVSLELVPGRTVAVVGANGAGKSTLMRLLLRFVEPTAGRILLDDRALEAITVESLRENIAIVSQEPLVFDATVRENIAFGRPGATAAQIVEAARVADAQAFIEALPEGYDTRVGQRGRLLSGGERQKLAIARAAVRDAPLLVLDEPTAGLDRAAARRIAGPLRSLGSGRATLLIAHDLEQVRHVDEIVVLEQGRVVERGTHDELVARGGAYGTLFGQRGEAADAAAVGAAA